MMAKRIAKLHSLEMPICKTPIYMETLVGKILQRIRDHRKVPLEEFAEEERKDAEYLRNFPFKEEFEWIRRSFNSINSRVVLCHNDLQRLNMVKLKDKDTIEDQLMILDYETVSYYYRGFEFGQYFRAWEVDWSLKKDPFIGIQYPNEEVRRQFLRDYLKEWKKLNPHLLIDEVTDSEDHLMKEVDFFAFVADFYIMEFFYDFAFRNCASITIVSISLLLIIP